MINSVGIAWDNWTMPKTSVSLCCRCLTEYQNSKWHVNPFLKYCWTRSHWPERICQTWCLHNMTAQELNFMAKLKIHCRIMMTFSKNLTFLILRSFWVCMDTSGPNETSEIHFFLSLTIYACQILFEVLLIKKSRNLIGQESTRP